MNENSKKRTNGFSWPPDKAQIIMWLIMLYFAISIFSCFCVSLSEPWSYSIAIVFAIIFLIHLIFNVWCMATNPCEEALTKRKIMPESIFDRNKHKHVIENHFCNICQIAVSNKAKHCRKCNKCITDFDHHCIYLNNCIGGRNYKIFILTIVSGFIAALCIFSFGSTLFITSYFDDQKFLSKKYYKLNDTSSSKALSDKNKFLPIFAPVPIAGWRAFVAITSILALIAAVLIGYLIGYHIFLAINKMSTYDHTIKLKEESDRKIELKNKKKTPVEGIVQQTKSNSQINQADAIKLEEKNKNSYYHQNRSLSDFDSDLHIDREYYKEQTHSELKQDCRSHHNKKKKVDRLNTESTSALSCSKSEINRKYFLIQDEYEKSNESFFLTQLSSNFEKQTTKEKNDRKLTSNIVRLPPIIPVPNTRSKN